MMRLRLNCVVWLLLTLAFENQPLASPESESEALIAAGVDLRRQGDHEKALELFEKAYEVNPSARALAQRGLAEISLRRWLAAENHLNEALSRRDSAWIEAKETREVLGKALTGVRIHIGKVWIEGPPGAEVTIDDRVIGRLPLAEAVEASEGETRIVISVPGRTSTETKISIVGGQERVVRVAAGRDAPPTIAVPRPRLTPPPTPAAVASATSRSAPSSAESGRTSGRTWAGVGLLATGAGALATGIVWFAVDDSGTCEGASCKHLYETKTRGWIGIAAGSALIATGATLLLWPSSSHDVRLGLLPGGVIAVGTF